MKIGKGPAPISGGELARARKLLASPKKLAALLPTDELEAGQFGGVANKRRNKDELLAIEEALTLLGGSAEDPAVLSKQVGHAASKSMQQILEAVRALKSSGYLADVRGADTVTDDVLVRAEAGNLPKHLARHVQKIARAEAFRLFAHPVKDEAFQLEVGRELKRTFHVKAADLEKLEAPPELTIRDKNHRQSNALRALLTDPALSASLKIGAIERLAKIGDRSAIPALEKVLGDPALAKAAKASIAAIKQFGKMTIVFASMEVKPYAGTGGLGNVMSELPAALARMGHKVIVIAPRHAVIDREKLSNTEKEGIIFGPDGTEGFGLFLDKKDGVDHYFIENDRYFSKDRPGIYGSPKGDYSDNAERYDFFGASIPAALKLILGANAPDVVQLNDAHTATAAAYLKRDGAFGDTKTIMAVHNLGGAYQGKYDKSHLGHMRFDGLGLYYPAGPAEFHDQLNLLKLGLVESHGAITVSRQYMKEVLTEDQGEGLHGVMRVLHAKDKLWGNLNGIDNAAWDPQTDPLIPHHFSIDDLSGKKANKASLQAQFGLAQDAETPLVGVVARLTNQKGFDDIIASVKKAMEGDKKVQFLIVGQGDPAIAKEIEALVAKYPGKVAFDQKFDATKEHRIYAGSDFFLMPSKFEPCGLPQMYALRYATVPIVRAVGGLEESIADYDPKAGTGNGFKFETDLSACLDRALGWYEKDDRQGLLANCAASDFSWEKSSAIEQLAFYRQIIHR